MEQLRLEDTSQCHLVQRPLTAEPTSRSDATSKLDQVAQGHIHLNLEYLQGWRHLQELMIWSTCCSPEVFWYLSMSQNAAVQQWANGSSCTGQSSAGPWSFREVAVSRAFFPVPQEKTITISTGVTSKLLVLSSSSLFLLVSGNISCQFVWTFIVLQYSFYSEKKKEAPQIPVKPQTLEL